MVSSTSTRVQFARRIALEESSLRLYAILDAESCARRGLSLTAVAQAWRDAGIKLLQYRDKGASDTEFLSNAAAIESSFRSDGSMLLLNDRAHLLRQAGWDGVHIGQTDGEVARTRSLIGDEALIGLSTHSPEQAVAAGTEDIDYIAAGPVFATGSKLDADPVIGLCNLQAIRALIRQPLVAIGGITAQRAPQVIHAGADCVAVISSLLPPTNADHDALVKAAQDFLAAFK